MFPIPVRFRFNVQAEQFQCVPRRWRSAEWHAESMSSLREKAGRASSPKPKSNGRQQLLQARSPGSLPSLH